MRLLRLALHQMISRVFHFTFHCFFFKFYSCQILIDFIVASGIERWFSWLWHFFHFICAAARADNFLLKTILITHYTRPRTASQGSPLLYVWLGCGLRRPQCCTLFNISEKVLIFFKFQTGSRSLHSNCTHNLYNESNCRC